VCFLLCRVHQGVDAADGREDSTWTTDKLVSVRKRLFWSH
jgi:hypothetical protein